MLPSSATIVEVEFRRLVFPFIFLRRVTHFCERLLTIQGVRVDGEFRIEAVHITTCCHNQWVDFDEREIAFVKHLRKAHEDIGKLVNLFAFKAQLERNVPALVSARTCQWVDNRLQDFLRRFFSYLFNLNTTFGRCHERDALAATIDNRTEVQLTIDIRAFLNKNLADRLTVLIGLEGHKVCADMLVGKVANLVSRAYQLHATGLTSATSVHLDFHYPAIAADLLGSLYSLVSCVDSVAGGYRQAVLGKQLLRLILMKVHNIKVLMVLN